MKLHLIVVVVNVVFELLPILLLLLFLLLFSLSCCQQCHDTGAIKMVVVAEVAVVIKTGMVG